MRVSFRLAIAIAVVACGSLTISWARSPEPDRLACPLTGDVDCRELDCPLYWTERGLRDASARVFDAMR